jgi:hypothetical protein
LVHDKNISSNTNTECFIETMNFLKKQGDNYITVSENPPIVRYFTNTESSFYPDKITEESLKEVSNSTNKTVYFIFNKLNSGFETDKWMKLNEILGEDYGLKFKCPEDPEVNFVYSNKLN